MLGGWAVQREEHCFIHTFDWVVLQSSVYRIKSRVERMQQWATRCERGQRESEREGRSVACLYGNLTSTGLTGCLVERGGEFLCKDEALQSFKSRGRVSQSKLAEALKSSRLWMRQLGRVHKHLNWTLLLAQLAWIIDVWLQSSLQ